MKNKNVLYILGMITFLSACGLKGEREQSSAQAQAQAPVTQIQPFKTLTTQSSLGSTEMVLATGTINPNDPQLHRIGDFRYVIEKVKPHLDNPSLGPSVESTTSESSFSVYVELNTQNWRLISVVPDETKSILMNPVLKKKEYNVGINGKTMCDRYTLSPNVPYIAPNSFPTEYGPLMNGDYLCSFQTGDCITPNLPTSHYKVSVFEELPKYYPCTGKRGFYYEKFIPLVDSERVKELQVVIDPTRSIKSVPLTETEIRIELK